MQAKQLFFITFTSVLLLLCVSSCKHDKEDQLTAHSFYYWKTTPEPNIRVGLPNGTDHFYVRYFDVDWSESRRMAVPVGELQPYYGESYPFVGKPFTPVVFITNRTFEQLHGTEIDSLAVRIKDKIADITSQFDEDAASKEYNRRNLPYDAPAADSIKESLRKTYAAQHPEVQIDCDWTAGTRDSYFLFLKKLKSLLRDKTISATIRLYPYKYQSKMGVPPVDRGMLMCYNMGQIGNAATTNSIFSVKELKQYLDAPAYPLPMDYALPVFGWAVWFRGGQLKGILHEADTAVWKKEYGFYMRSLTKWAATKDVVLKGAYIREGDELRLEYPSDAELEEAANLLAKKIPHPRHVALYHWDQQMLQQYAAVIEKVFHP